MRTTVTFEATWPRIRRSGSPRGASNHRDHRAGQPAAAQQRRHVALGGSAPTRPAYSS